MVREKIDSDITRALKSGDAFTVGVLRMIRAALHNKEIEKRGAGMAEELHDDEVIEVIRKEAKKRTDAATLYTEGNRADRAEQEIKEAALLKQYLPEQVSREEIERCVERAIAQSPLKEFGALMKIAMQELRGRADGKLVSEYIKKRL